jgi:hypothetical protein
MQHVPLDGKLYIGGDIVQEMVEKLQQRHWSRNREFRLLDIVDDPLPEADLWMCRDVLFHLPEADALKVLRRAGQSNIKYFLSSTFPFVRKNVKGVDTNLGWFRYINLCKPPYNLPRPLRELEDFIVPYPPKVLGLWSREQLQEAAARFDE